MYYVYEKLQSSRGFRYKYREDTRLAGCKMGKIPHLLEIHLDGSGSEPLRWHYILEEELARTHRWKDCALIIDLKPNDPERKLSLYEIVEAWGYSCRGWTPILLRLRGLFVDQSSAQIDPHDFVYEDSGGESPIFSMMYMRGTVKDGCLEGTWAFPRPSSTNSVLLWPETLNYFADEAAGVMRRLDHGGSRNS